MHMLADPTGVKLEPIQLARLARTAARAATMGRLIRAEGGKAPIATRVATASRHDGAPLVQCSKKLAPPRVTLLVENEIGALSIGIQGKLTLASRNDVERFFRRHTEAEATDASVAVFALKVEAAYVETSDGVVRWISADDYLLPILEGDLEQSEAGIVEHVNGGHPDTIHAILSHRGLGADDWVMIGADPEGIDVVRGDRTLRIVFDTPVYSREAFKKTMVNLRVVGGGPGKPAQAAAE